MTTLSRFAGDAGPANTMQPDLVSIFLKASIMALIAAAGLALWPPFRPECKGIARRALLFFAGVTMPGVIFAVIMLWFFGALS